MRTSRIRTLAAVATLAVATTLATAPARGDDTELFVGEAVAGAPARPNAAARSANASALAAS